MDFNEWMKKNDEIFILMRDTNTAEEILEKIDIKKDFDFLITNSMLEKEKFIDIVNLLLQREQLDVIENSIEDIDSSFWPDLLVNNKFKQIFLDNGEKILESKERGFSFSTISSLVHDERGEEFFTNNAELICNRVNSQVSEFIATLTKETEYGEDLLIEYQSELFKNIWGMKYVISDLKKEEIDLDKYIQGMLDNLSQILEDDITVVKEVNEILNESQLPKEKINELKEQILSTLTQDGELLDLVDNHIKNKNDANMIQTMLDIGVDKNILESKSREWLESLNGAAIFNYVKICKENEWLPEEYNIGDLLKSLYKDKNNTQPTNTSEKNHTGDLLESIYKDIYSDSQTMYMIEKLITEVAENQNMDPLDAEMIGRGAYNNSIKIGEYILKIGRERATNEIPYHRRLNQPLIRQQSNPGSTEEKLNIFIEIQNCVDAKWYQGMTDYEIKEALYNIYSELRDDGIIWTDVKIANVGRLLKPNVPTFIQDGQELSINSVSTEMTDIKDEKPLEAGELVIIDTDFIYRESNVIDKKYTGAKYSYHKEFEERYQREKSERQKLDNSITLESGNVVSQSVLDFNDSLVIKDADTIHTTSYSTDDRESLKNRVDVDKEELG